MVKKSAYNGPRNSRIKRQRARRRKKMMIRAGAAALCLAAVIGAVSGIRALVGGHKTKNQEHITSMEETLPQKLKEINGISVKGLGYEKTVAALIKGYDWNLSVSYEGKTEKLNNLIEARTRQYLDEICTQNMEGSYTFDLLDVSELAKEEAGRLAGIWDQKPENSTLDHYDAASGKFVFCGGKDGVVIDQEKLAADISQAVKDQKLDQSLSAEGNFQAADSDEAVQAKYKTLETFTTNTTSNPKRNTNVRLAAEALNGTIVQPGEEFSFNQVIGPRTEEKGYQAAAAYNSGEVVQEVGGGVCQISSTLYRVVFETGMEVTYRRSHTFEPNYVTPGQDATISWDMPDFRFVNTSEGAIGIRASYADQKATVSIYGIPVLDDGVTWKLYSEKTEEGEKPEPQYVEDPTLAPGTEKVKSNGTTGSTWVTYKVIYKDGVEIDRVKDHEKIYKGHAPVILRNTGTTQVTAEAGDGTANGQTTEEAVTAAIPVDGMDDETHSGASRTDGEMSQSGTQSSTAVSETTGTETVQTTEAETVIEPEPVVAPAENLSETVQQIPPL